MLRHRANKDDPAYLAAHASAEALYNRLGNDITTLSDGDDPTNRQALVDASERYNTAGAQIGTSKTAGELAVARETVIEGLHATRLMRKRLGLDPGPDPAELPADPTPAQTHPWDVGLGHPGGGRGLGGDLGAGAAGGLLGGLLGGGLAGELFGGGGGDGGGWGDDQGGWGDDGGADDGF